MPQARGQVGRRLCVGRVSAGDQRCAWEEAGESVEQTREGWKERAGRRGLEGEGHIGRSPRTASNVVGTWCRPEMP